MENITIDRKIPVRYEADVAVLGAGIAGVSAALAAARDGAKVVLVERFGVVGGNATSGGVASFCGSTVGQGDIFDQIVKNLTSFNAIVPLENNWNATHTKKKTSRVFDHSILAVILQEMIIKAGVKLLLHTRLADVKVNDNGRITEAIICGSSGLEALRAKLFVDATGDGLLGNYAGFAAMKGSEESKYQLPMSLMYFIRHIQDEKDAQHIPEGWFEHMTQEDDLPMTSIWPNGPGANAIKIKVPMFDSSDTEGLTEAEIAGRRKMMAVLDYHQRVENRPWILDYCSPIIGIREGWRVTGDYILKTDDLRAGRSFDTAVARGTFYLDGHKPDDDKRTYILPVESLQVPPYHIPMECLVAKDGINLLTAGRCFSAEQLALSSARVATTCSMMGQAAGIAAVMCVNRGCDIRDLDYRKVRARVEETGGDLDISKPAVY